ncbi:MAG: GNAT family N-acetyltransferase, partial [Acidimicrobiales bacterium]
HQSVAMIPRTTGIELTTQRLVLRPLRIDDWEDWRTVRQRCEAWLLKWEPRLHPGYPDPTKDRRAFGARCGARDRERELGIGYGFGIFVEGDFCGEININSIQRGPFQNAYVGYWIDEEKAGLGYMPEAVVAIIRFGLEELGLHRIQVSIIPRNVASRRVVEKLELREEGVALRYLEINGIWEDHVRYAITVEEWKERGPAYKAAWLD